MELPFYDVEDLIVDRLQQMVRIQREACCSGFRCSHGGGGRWTLGVFYVVSVAAIWIAASYIVQSVVDDGVSPFLITYICNSLFLIYIPLVEIARYFEDSISKLWKWRPWGSDKGNDVGFTFSILKQDVNLLPEDGEREGNDKSPSLPTSSSLHILPSEDDGLILTNTESATLVGEGFDAKQHWTRARIAKVSLLICPFWFVAQLTFNYSLKYTTVSVG